MAAAGTIGAGGVRARYVCLFLAAVLPAGKAIQLAWFDGWDVARQLLLLAVAVSAVAVAVRPLRPALFEWQFGVPRAPRDPVRWRHHWRWAWLAVGVAAPLLCAVSVVSHVQGSQNATVALTATALVPLIALSVWEWRRHRAFRDRPAPNRPRPHRAMLWTVAPATFWWVAIILVSAVLSNTFDGTLGDFEFPYVEGAGGRALGTTVVIGFGEEYLFRGLLLVLAVAGKLSGGGFAVIGVSFGLWHLPDAWNDGAATAAVTVAAMFAVSQVVFIPLRLRSRTVAGPALLHAAHNLALRLI